MECIHIQTNKQNNSVYIFIYSTLWINKSYLSLYRYLCYLQVYFILLLLLILRHSIFARINIHKCPRICRACRNHNPVLSLFMTYHWVCNKCNTTGVTCGAGTDHPSGAPEFTTVFSGVGVARSLVSYVSFIVVCPFSIVHCVFGTSSIYDFWIHFSYLHTSLTYKIWHYHVFCYNDHTLQYYGKPIAPLYISTIYIKKSLS